jgi:hypothetical protein
MRLTLTPEPELDWTRTSIARKKAAEARPEPTIARKA